MFLLCCINVTTMVLSAASQTRPTAENDSQDRAIAVFLNVFCYFVLSDIFLRLYI